MTTYRFDEQLSIGQQGERLIAQWYEAQGYTVLPASERQQYLGIDFLIHKPGHSVEALVEVKTDRYKTGNIFIETISNDKTGTEGWVYKTFATRLVYYLEKYSIAYVFYPPKLREKLSEWKGIYPLKEVDNKTYKTHGYLVPIAVVAKIALETIQLPNEQP